MPQRGAATVSNPPQVLQSSVRKITNHLICVSSSTFPASSSAPKPLKSKAPVTGDTGHVEWGEGNLEKG